MKGFFMRKIRSAMPTDQVNRLPIIYGVMRNVKRWQIGVVALLALTVLLPISIDAQIILAPNAYWTVINPSSLGSQQMPIGNGSGFSPDLPAPNSAWSCSGNPPTAPILDLETTIDLTGYDPSLVYYSIAIDSLYQLSVNGVLIDSLDCNCSAPSDAAWGASQNLLAKAAAQGVTLNPGVNTIQVQIASEEFDDPDGNGYFAMLVYATNAAFVAVTSDSSGKAAYSFDGMNWSASTLPNTSGWTPVCYGNGQFVAVSQAGYDEATSRDGINWVAHPSSGCLPPGGWNLAYGDGAFVAVPTGFGNAADYSSDGLNWVSSVTGLPSAGYTFSVAYGNDVFATVSDFYGVEAYSDSRGAYWVPSRQRLANSYSCRWSGLTYGNGIFVAVSLGGCSGSSPDGNIWTSGSMPSGTAWSSVAFGNGIFAAVAADGSVASSADGINWTVGSGVLTPASGWGNVTFGVANGSGIFVAVQNGGAGAAFSVDGMNWSLSSAGMPSAQAWSSVAAGQ
jgi:hypothetical protein